MTKRTWKAFFREQLFTIVALALGSLVVCGLIYLAENSMRAKEVRRASYGAVEWKPEFANKYPRLTRPSVLQELRPIPENPAGLVVRAGYEVSEKLRPNQTWELVLMLLKWLF